jgi:hypothetical protein
LTDPLTAIPTSKPTVLTDPLTAIPTTGLTR